MVPHHRHSARMQACDLFVQLVGPGALDPASPLLALRLVVRLVTIQAKTIDRQCRLVSMCQVPRYSRSRFHQLEPFSIRRDRSLEHVFVEQVFSLFIVIVVISSIPFSPSLSHL